MSNPWGDVGSLVRVAHLSDLVQLWRFRTANEIISSPFECSRHGVPSDVGVLVAPGWSALT